VMFVYHDEHLRQLALRVFSNAMAICSSDGCLAIAVQNQQWFRDTLFPTLLDELKRTNVSSNCAYEATSCILSLASCSKVALQDLLDSGVVVSLQHAYEYDCERHELLAEEAKRCLEVFKITHDGAK
jgi:hypothetical protein